MSMNIMIVYYFKGFQYNAFAMATGFPTKNIGDV